MLIGELFGTPSHEVVKSICSSRKSIFIDFNRLFDSYMTDIYQYTIEFVASINYYKNNPDCQTWLKSDILLSPKYPNINCSWIVTKKSTSYITLDFIFIEVKPVNITKRIHKLQLQFLKIA